MNDFDYDVLQKKRIAQGAKHLKRGSRSRRCSLPSDHLTPAQLKRRNGPVSTYKMDRPMSWYDLRGMPDDLKKQYLTNLVETYGATDDLLGDMFHVHPTSVGLIRRRLGVPKAGRLMGQPKARRDAMWAAFCNGVVGGGDAAADARAADEPQVPVVQEEVLLAPAVQDGTLPAPVGHDDVFPATAEHDDDVFPATACAKEPPTMSLTELNAVFNGFFRPQDFLTWIAKLPIPEHEVRIRVEVETL